MSEWTIQQAQQAVDQWIRSKGVRYFSELNNTVQLMEEVGELARVIGREYGEQSWKTGEETSQLADELADVFFVLICLANQTGVDLSAALADNMEKKSVRDERRHAENPKLQSQTGRKHHDQN